jgi:integrase/recombinase XerD
MHPHTTPLGPLWQRVCGEYLCTQQRARPHTIARDRDPVRVVREFLRATHGMAPAAAGLAALEVPVLRACLEDLAHTRHHAIRSRPLRLAAIRSCCRRVARRDPASVQHAARVLAIPVTRAERPVVKARSRAEMDAILAAAALGHGHGRRDPARLVPWDHRGARVSALTALEQSQGRLGAQRFLQLQGQGRQERTVPWWTTTARTLHAWVRDRSSGQTRLAFPRAHGRKLPRHGVDSMVPQVVAHAAPPCPSVRDKPVTPHTRRPTTATPLLQAGVDLAAIARWLGHERTETTPRSLEADRAPKAHA